MEAGGAPLSSKAVVRSCQQQMQISDKPRLANLTPPTASPGSLSPKLEAWPGTLSAACACSVDRINRGGSRSIPELALGT